MEHYPELLVKWEEKKGHYNMASVESHKDQKQKEEDIWVVTRGCIRTRSNIEQGEISGQNVEGNIIKLAEAPPKYDIVQQKKFCMTHTWHLIRITCENNCNAHRRGRWKNLAHAENCNA
jgi:hypothetical protein